MFDKLFAGYLKRLEVNGYFRVINGYTPVFTTHDGGVYEMELTRACIHTFASHCSKLQPHVTGPDLRGIQSVLDGKPNEFMLSSQFVYKVATIYEAKNTCVIVPLMDRFGRTCGYYPANPSLLEVVDVGGEPYVRLTFASGEKVAVELARCGIVSKYLYNSDIVGESNDAVQRTLQLLHMQDQGIVEGIKNGSSFRFMATLANMTKRADRKREREDFVKDTFGPDGGGLALFPNTMTNIQQITSNAKVVDPEQMELIQTRALNYFGTSMDILQNKYKPDDWAAYYEGKVEVFAIQLSQAMTAMTYSANERSRGNGITWSANRLQYLSNADKLQVTTQLFDRGLLTINGAMDIWNLPHVPDGDRRYIRKEYIDTALVETVPETKEEDDDPEGQAEL